MTALHKILYEYIGAWVFFLPILVMVFWLVLIRLKKEPTIDSMREFINLLNTRGGNILILAAMSSCFFYAAMKLFYAMIDLAVNGKLSTDNAFPMMALQFVTSSAFGGAFGAMLTMMTGADSKGIAPKAPVDVIPGDPIKPIIPAPDPAPVLSVPKG